MFSAAHAALPVEGDRSSKVTWRETVRRVKTVELPPGAVWVDIAVRASRSLEGLLKPIIDGLDPILGSDPVGRGEFAPDDSRIEWLRIARTPQLPCDLVITAGPMQPSAEAD